MSVSFYMDENVHGTITTGLRQREVDVLTVQEDDRSGMTDPEVLDRATELQQRLFSQDDDLLVEATSGQVQGIYFPSVMFARQSRVSIGTCIRNLEVPTRLPALTQPSLKDLLAQLKIAIDQDPELSDDEKAEALGKVAKLAKASSNPQEGAMQRLAQRATNPLKAIAETLTDASTLATACKTLIPAIAALF